MSENDFHNNIIMCQIHNFRESEKFIRVFKVFRRKNETAFIIGNGLNQYVLGENEDISWKGLMGDIAKKEGLDMSNYSNMAPTEQFSAFTLARKEKDVNDILVDRLKGLNGHIKEFTDINLALKCSNSPVLTTNLDCFLDQGLNLYDSPYKENASKFAEFLLHESMWCLNHYYAPQELKNPNEGYAVWHINGHISHPETARMGLVSYGKLLARIYPVLERQETYSPAVDNTWLNPFFNRKLCIMGIRLGQQEILLRWLLLRRAFKRKHYHMDVGSNGWYLFATCEREDLEGDGTLQFLKSVGITPVEFPSYDAIYEKTLLENMV